MLLLDAGRQPLFLLSAGTDVDIEEPLAPLAGGAWVSWGTLLGVGAASGVDKLLGSHAAGETLLGVGAATGVDELLGSHAAGETLLGVGTAAGVDELLAWEMLLGIGATAGINELLGWETLLGVSTTAGVNELLGWETVKSGSTLVGGPVKSGRKRTEDKGRGLDKRLVQPELVTAWIQ